ncbi:MAG: KamA family radical SAM protein [Tindallia sp. MSAO_Bac2]|nr:MAG: KamA family radical SAM protein [Tindallia sp. MSAO_Bac2]
MPDFESLNWKEELKNNIKTIDELKNFIDLTETEESDLRKVVKQHPMNIPRYYMNLADPADPEDPIRKLSVPSIDELFEKSLTGNTTDDPYGDDKHDKGNGVLHKYPYTALVVATEYCSMYCRHCFRKRMVGLSTNQTVKNFKNAAEYIADHSEIKNVVISGGDPFLLGTEALREMLNALKNIDHLNYVRIGSRAPVVYPLRFMDDELMEVLKEFNEYKALYVPTHFNTAKEITPLATKAVGRLRKAGLTVNNQAVFLKGVNDSVEKLVELMDGLVRIGVNPYYLYQCMPVSKVRRQFQVPLKEGTEIVSEAKRRLDGYAKRFKFIMGDDSGKIEICGSSGNYLVMSQIHSRPEEPEQASKIMIKELTDDAGWLDDLGQDLL